MGRYMVLSVRVAGVCLAVASVVCPAWSAQEPTRVPEHIILPPAAGATPLSVFIEAQAKYIAAQGAYAVSIAVARKIHAEAVALEIENSVKYVDAYFERRAINRGWREKENPSYWARVERRQEFLKQRMERYFDEVLKGDRAAALNWLLTELSGPTMAVQYLSDREILAPLDSKLLAEDRKQIWLTDGGVTNEKLVFSLHDGRVLSTPWPLALRGPEFASARRGFETARDKVLTELQNPGHIGAESGEQLTKAVNELLVTLETAYPKEERIRYGAMFLNYNSAKNYLRSLVGQVNRVRTTNDYVVVGGTIVFEGETVLDLLQYMYQRGFMFYKPAPGGERVYQVLLMSMRNMYLQLSWENEEEEFGKAAAKQ